MTKVTVNLNEMGKVNRFVNVVATFESDIDVVRGRYVIDGRSIMGLFSLDLSKPIDVILHSEDEKEISRFIEAMKKYQ